jgi:hypothetical protein
MRLVPRARPWDRGSCIRRSPWLARWLGPIPPGPARLILDPLRAFAKGRPFEWYLTPVGSFGSPSSS